ncbi:3-dehydroquinate synthase II [Saccharopolyspora pogona]|uniref:3-dehydroquinate synthase II n=1 Tax=Saccharopolyspora pogona TaxID=333966 RepID=UPI00168304F9|nr:3-dehydroquinate synthase II [Saccharopolyspora pogona]
MKLTWVDVRTCPTKSAVLEEALHIKVDGILSDSAADFDGLPPTVRKILFPTGKSLPDDFGQADVVIVVPDEHGQLDELAAAHPEIEFGQYVEITDAATLDEACRSARSNQWSLLYFRDPTKIPLEIVIAAAAGSSGKLVTIAQDVTEAEIIFGVLEHGSDGVMLAPAAVGDTTALKAAAADGSPALDLVELTVTTTEHVGMGERACVDTCTYFRKDEGILVGSHSKGMILCVSETHPLPYMPTRPFRVNAGAIHSYTLSAEGRTHYLSELKSGSKVMAVDTSGRTRMVTVGRVKIESRPLISVDAVAPDGQTVNLILQDDWHVRVLGPAGVVLNSTELKPGDTVLGYLPTQDRHVGYPINEFCLEK